MYWSDIYIHIYINANICIYIYYSDLQNPLIKKYKFDPKNFLVGSKEVFCVSMYIFVWIYIFQVHQAIASFDFFNYSIYIHINIYIQAFLQVHQAIASADFFNYSNGFSSTSDADTILKVYICIYIYIYMYTYICIHMFVYSYTVCVFLYKSLYIHVYVYKHLIIIIIIVIIIIIIIFLLDFPPSQVVQYLHF
jgi:hypothetical protein